MLTKTLLLFFVTHCLIIAVEGGKADAEEASEICRKQYNLTKEEVQKLDDPKTSGTNDDNVKCFLKCFYNELKVMDEKGEYTLDASGLEPKDKQLLAACTDVTGTDPCDKAFNFNECLGMELKKRQKNGA